MSVRIQILANYRAPAELLRQLCGRTVKSTGDWNWAITDPVHLPFSSIDPKSLPSLSLRISLEDGDWQMEVYSEGSRVLKIRDREENGSAVAKKLLQTGVPISSEEQLVQALERKNITEGETRWPVGTLPRVLELLHLNEIFPDWREEARKEELIPAQEAPAQETTPEIDPDALYNGKSGWFRELYDRNIPQEFTQAAINSGFELIGIIASSKYEDLCFAVFRHGRENVYLVYDLEFKMTMELFSFSSDKILVTCNHAYPILTDSVISQQLPRKSLGECLSKHLEKLTVLPETRSAVTLADFCVLYDRYLAEK
jgi:hypothetical protein